MWFTSIHQSYKNTKTETWQTAGNVLSCIVISSWIDVTFITIRIILTNIINHSINKDFKICFDISAEGF